MKRAGGEIQAPIAKRGRIEPPEDCFHLQDFLEADTNTYGYLYLNYNIAPADSSLIKLFSEKLTLYTSLTNIILRNSNIKQGVFNLLLSALKKATNLASLCLYGNDLRDCGVKLLADELLTGNKTLQKLELGNNDIGPVGCQWLIDALKSNSSLVCLNIGENNLGNQGALILGAGLKDHASLARLNLKENQIRYEGIEAIGDLLTGTIPLVKLNLRSNIVKDKGVRALTGSLAANRTLTALNLDNCFISDFGARDLAKLLLTNSSLTSLQMLDNDDLSSKGIEKFEFALQQGNITLLSLDLGSTYMQNYNFFIEESIIEETTTSQVELLLERNYRIFELVAELLQNIISSSNLLNAPPCWQLKYYQKANPVIFKGSPEGYSCIEDFSTIDRLVAINFFSLTGICKVLTDLPTLPTDLWLEISSNLRLYNIETHEAPQQLPITGETMVVQLPDL